MKIFSLNVVNNQYFKPVYRIKPVYGFIFLVFSLFAISCNSDKKTNSESAENTVKAVQVPQFASDSAYQYIKKQLSFGPRVPNSKGHVACGQYLEKQLAEYGWEVKIQEFQRMAFDGKMLKLKNIIASYNPKASKRILLSSHWDSRPFADQDSVDQQKPIPAANDGASGVAVLLELARTLQNASVQPTVGIDIVLFDGEDYGQPENSGFPEQKDTWCYGSQYWSKNPHVTGYQAYFGVLLDMVGAKNATFGLEGTSRMYAEEVMKKVWATAHRLGYGNFFIDEETSPILDDHHYINKDAHIPTIDIIDYDPSDDVYFGWYWHTHHDDLASIDPKTLKAVGQTLVQVVYEE